MRDITPDELREILEVHKKWLASDGKEGVMADLSDADLSRANLHYAKLSNADLSRANLSGANLSIALLHKTKLREEDLTGIYYNPEQLKDMIIERPEREPIMVPEEKGTLTIHFAKEAPPTSSFYLSKCLSRISIRCFLYIPL